MQDERLPKRGGGQSDGDAEGRRRERVQRRSVVFANMPSGICNADVVSSEREGRGVLRLDGAFA